MGCQASKQCQHTKAGKSKLPKIDTNENANASSEGSGQAALEKLQLKQSSKELPAEKVTFSTDERNDELGNSVGESQANNSSVDLKVRTIALRNGETNESTVGNYNQSRRKKIDKYESQKSAEDNKDHKHLDEKLNKKNRLNNGSRQLQIRTKTKRSRADPEDDTLYEIPLKMPEFDLVPSQSDENVA